MTDASSGPIIAVSTMCFREQLGTIAIEFPGTNGETKRFEMAHPKLMELADLPGRIAAEFEIGFLETVGFQFTGPEDPELARFVAALHDADVQLLNVSIDAGDLLDSRGPDTAQQLIFRWISAFAAAQPRFIRVRAHWNNPPIDADVPPASLVAALKKIATKAESIGAKLLIENLGGPSSNPRWVGNLVEALGSDNLGLALDLGNFDVLLATRSQSDMPAPTTDELETVYAAIADMSPFADLVHLKVLSVTDQGVTGPVDVVRALRILDDSGFSGPLTVEYEGESGDPWVNVGRVLEIVRREQGKRSARAIPL